MYPSLGFLLVAAWIWMGQATHGAPVAPNVAPRIASSSVMPTRFGDFYNFGNYNVKLSAFPPGITTLTATNFAEFCQLFGVDITECPKPATSPMSTWRDGFQQHIAQQAQVPQQPQSNMPSFAPQPSGPNPNGRKVNVHVSLSGQGANDPRYRGEVAYIPSA